MSGKKIQILDSTLRDGAQGDPGGAYEDQGVHAPEQLAVEGLRGLDDGPEARFLKAGKGVGRSLRLRQGRQHPSGQSAAPAAVGKDRQLHFSAARNSVLKSGSESLERS